MPQKKEKVGQKKERQTKNQKVTTKQESSQGKVIKLIRDQITELQGAKRNITKNIPLNRRVEQEMKTNGIFFNFFALHFP